MTTQEEIAKRIADQREYMNRQHGGYTQADVAKTLGWTRTRYAAVEQAKRPLRVHDLNAVAKAIGCKASHLLGEVVVDVPDEPGLRFYAGLPPDRRRRADEMLRAAFAEEDQEEATVGRRAD